MRNFLVRFANDEGGAAAVEYGLLVAAIAAVIIVTVFALGSYVEGAFSYTCNQLSTNTSGLSTKTC